jgi:hypothetical protein
MGKKSCTRDWDAEPLVTGASFESVVLKRKEPYDQDEPNSEVAKEQRSTNGR